MSFSLVRATHRHGLPGRALIVRHSSIGIEFLSYFGSLVRFWIESAKNCAGLGGMGLSTECIPNFSAQATSAVSRV